MQFLKSKYIFTAVWLLLSPLLQYAQSQQAAIVDSLEKKLTTAAADSNKVKLLNELSYYHFNTDPQTGINYGSRGLALATKIGWQKGIALSYTSLGANYWGLRNFLKAQEYYELALGINEAIGNKPAIAKSLQNIAILTQFPKCLTYYERASKIFESIGDKIKTEGAIQNMGMQYESHGNFSKALEYYQKGLVLAIQIKNDKNTANAMLNISRVYADSCNNEKAFEYGNKALELAKKIIDKPFLTTCVRNLGNVLMNQKKYDSSLVLYKFALHSLLPNDDRLTKEIIAGCALNAGIIYLKFAKKEMPSSAQTKNLQKAVSLFEQSLAIYRTEFSWSPVVNKEPLKYLSEALAKQGNYKEALKLYQQYTALSDSVYNTENTKVLADKLLEFENYKQKDSLVYLNKLKEIQSRLLLKEKKLNVVRIRDYWFITLLIVMVIAIVGISLFLRNQSRHLVLKNELAKEKAEKALKESEYSSKLNEIKFAALQSQMNPHFIFNCLNSIKLYMEENNSAAASDYLTKFSKLIRNILDNAAVEKIDLASEIASLRLYLEMESMRFMEKLHYSIKIDSNIDTEFIKIPPMLIQPFVENSIWHGLMNKKEGGMIQIHIIESIDNTMLIIKIADNGIGRKKAELLKNELLLQKKSYGTLLTGERLALMNEKSNTQGNVLIEDILNTADEVCGTLVTLHIPIKLNT
jgi:tetratricopeptide (TPR) repeat protein